MLVPRAAFAIDDPWAIPRGCTPVALRRATDGGAPRLATRLALYHDGECLTAFFFRGGEGGQGAELRHQRPPGGGGRGRARPPRRGGAAGEGGRRRPFSRPGAAEPLLRDRGEPARHDVRRR